MKKLGLKAIAFIVAMCTAAAFVLPLSACGKSDDSTDDGTKTEQPDNTDSGNTGNTDNTDNTGDDTGDNTGDNTDDTEQEEKVEIAYKGETGGSSDEYMGDPCPVYWIDASVQKPDNYTKIIGFNITVKYKSAGYYGGWADTKENPMGMILLTKGAHEPGEYVFTYPNGQSPTYDLSTSDIATFCTGKTGTYVVSNCFSNGIQVSASVGDTVTLSYTGRTALFTEKSFVMTAVFYLGKYEIKSVEWITGEPEEVEAIDWDSIKVEKEEYTDVRTVEGKDSLSDEEYEAQYPTNYVDITVPKTGKDSYPVILWIHGGGYTTGNRKSVLLQNNKEYLLSQGYAFVSVEYKLTECENSVYGEGCLEEGIGYEACSFAGTQKLGKLILFYDCNKISIEGDTDEAFADDIALRFKSQHWQVLKVEDVSDLSALKKAVRAAKKNLSQPTVVICRTQIGYGTPNAGTAKAHGTPLDMEQLEETKNFSIGRSRPSKCPKR